MGYRITTSVWDNSKAKGSDLTVLLAIADSADNETAIAFPSINALAKKARMSERTVQYAISKLSRMGELSVISRKGRGWLNFYRVDLHLLAYMGKGAKLAPFTEEEIVQSLHLFYTLKGANHDRKRCKPRQEKVQATTLPYKVLEPVIEPEGSRRSSLRNPEAIASEKATAAWEIVREQMERHRGNGTALALDDKLSVAVIVNDLGGKDRALALGSDELRERFTAGYVRRELAAYRARR